MTSSSSWSSKCQRRGQGTGAGWGARGPEAACRGVCAHSVEGGELFERIVDEDYQLTEVDTMVFVRQICDGILFMHKMRVLHLDLKVLGLGPPGEAIGAESDHSRSVLQTAFPAILPYSFSPSTHPAICRSLSTY